MKHPKGKCCDPEFELRLIENFLDTPIILVNKVDY